MLETKKYSRFVWDTVTEAVMTQHLKDVALSVPQGVSVMKAMPGIL